MGAAQPFESETKIGLGTTDDSGERAEDVGGSSDWEERERADRAMQYYVEGTGGPVAAYLHTNIYSSDFEFRVMPEKSTLISTSSDQRQFISTQKT